MILRPTNREAAGLVAGFGLWALAFTLLYGAHGVICSGDTFGPVPARWALIAILVTMIIAHAGLIAWFIYRLKASPSSRRLIRRASLSLAVAALGATLWTGIPALSLQIC